MEIGSNFVHSRWSGRLRSFRVILCRYPHTHFSTSVNIIRDITYMLEHLLQENTPFSVIFEANYWIPEWMCQFRTKESILWERSQGGESQLAKGASKRKGHQSWACLGMVMNWGYHPWKVCRSQTIPAVDGMIVEFSECRSLIEFTHLLRPTGNQGTVLQTQLAWDVSYEGQDGVCPGCSSICRAWTVIAHCRCSVTSAKWMNVYKISHLKMPKHY